MQLNNLLPRSASRMTNNIEEQNEVTGSPLAQDQDPKTPPTTTTTMAETEEPQTQQHHPETKKPPQISFSIWPPSQRTRDAVINRLIETLSTQSVLSKRYGTLPNEEASEAAKRIEEEAFAAAGASASDEDDGIEVLQVYSKEISKRMLETVKSRSVSASTPVKPSESAGGDPTSVASSEEISSAVTEA
ncbi:unnamed protein product [Ilex paraguariensis]|uniref:WPP domain-containing protein n=1 Tax=Ilex paraguariensis TaxID=185542 RepID=A0ABC8R9X8_9AQUA